MCPRCGKDMVDLGNISNEVLLSYPPSWKEVYVCHDCKFKKTIIEHGLPIPESPDISSYRDI